MTLLAMDTGQAACSVALWRDGASIAHRYTPMPKGHAAALVPMIEDVLSEAGVGLSDLTRLAVTVGPGTFTGLRVGLATARGLALATGKPLTGVTTLEAIAWSVRDIAADQKAVIAAAFDARRNEVYLQTFDALGRPLCEPKLANLDECSGDIPDVGNPVICVGTGADLVTTQLRQVGRPVQVSDRLPYPDARAVAEIAMGRDAEPGQLPGPLYLRAPDAKLPTRRV